MDQAYVLLQPLIDLVAMKYGTVVTLWMAGPQGAKGDINCVRYALGDDLIRYKLTFNSLQCSFRSDRRCESFEVAESGHRGLQGGLQELLEVFDTVLQYVAYTFDVQSISHY